MDLDVTREIFGYVMGGVGVGIALGYLMGKGSNTPDQVVMTDLTGDGNKDVVVGTAGATEKNYVFVGDGNGGFERSDRRTESLDGELMDKADEALDSAVTE